MNAQLALIAAGTIKRLASMSAPKGAAARIGISNVVVAVLLVISVMKVMTKQISAIITATGHTAQKPTECNTQT